MSEDQQSQTWPQPIAGERRRVAITGVGAVTPLGLGARTLHERWLAGVSGIVDGVGRCSEFDPREHLSAKEARRADRFTQLAIVAADEALRDAGLVAGEHYPADRVGCLIATGIGGIATIEQQHVVLMERGAERVSPLAVPLLMANAAAGVISMRHGLRGPSYAVASACASGAHALVCAHRMVAYGDADAVVVGGSEAALTSLAMAAFAAMEATSRSGLSCPFDRRRDGFVLGEGAGVLVLESERAARARGARILGYLRGCGMTSDAHHLTAPEPGGRGAARAIELALEDAGVTPEDVVYINAHGTSTPLNDRTETEAIKEVFGTRAWQVPVSSLKSAVGHLLGAAGAVEAIALLLALRDRVAPPTLNYEQPEEGLDLDYVPNAAKPLAVEGGRPLIGISNSFGFGGHNAVLCIEAAA
ncbi:beta-ketoacyl-[acyl-carrier-protein] synthase family protein [Thermoleophilum album]|uniref:beta-ketoacyl-[acyl-carrier-protein] synthase family protein n=1 Tax=Thermoleophilum album TaxID=29539 RepID=UPI000A7D284D|nr:beta-ketoacyl-ACP synthase II [Thermoleophilum album]